MRIGQLAKRADVSPDTIRYYEKIGLLSPSARTKNHYRDYGPEALDDLLFIKKAQASGLKLNDVRDVMQIASRGLPTCDHVRERVTIRLPEVANQLKELRALHSALKATLERLNSAPTPKAGGRCAAIESLG